MEIKNCKYVVGQLGLQIFLVEQSTVSQSLVHHSTSSHQLKVQVYRIGTHLLKADSPMVGNLIARGTWRFWKLGFCQSFSIPFSI